MLRAVVAAAVLAVVGAVGVVVVLRDHPPQAASAHVLLPPIYHETPRRDGLVRTFVIDPRDDRGKPGTVRGVLGQRYFEVPAGSSMASDDQLRFKFTARAEILQVDVSVDINDPRAELVEFLVGINTRGYGFNRDGDVLMHVSWSDRTPSQMDETVTLPSGTEVDAGDFLGISAWMGGEGLGDPIRVSPEVVVLYRWRTARRS